MLRFVLNVGTRYIEDLTVRLSGKVQDHLWKIIRITDKDIPNETILYLYFSLCRSCQYEVRPIFGKQALEMYPQ